MIDKTKVFNGPYTLILLAGEAEKYKIAGLKKDSISFGVENETDELEDKAKDRTGRNLVCESTHSELDISKLDNIEDSTIDTVRVEFTGKGIYLQFTNPTGILASIDNLKTKISIEKWVAANVTWVGLLTTGAIGS